MARLSRRQLITYAVVSQNLEGINDVLSGLMPFYDPLISEKDGQLFDPAVFACELSDTYDWPVNYDVVLDLIPRLERAGRIERVEGLDSGRNGDGDVAFICRAVRDESIDDEEIKAEQKLRKVSIQFQKFSVDMSPLFHREKSIEELEDILLNWLVAVEGYDKKTLSEKVDRLLKNEILEDEVGSESADHLPIFAPANLRAEESYLCARFVQYISQRDKELFDHLVDIATVALLTEVVLDVRNPPDAARKEPNLTIIFDAPLLMDALGLSGKDAQARMAEMIANLRKMEVKIWAFSHSCIEIFRNLRRLLEMPPYERYGPTADAIRQGQLMEEYARSVMTDVEGYLEEKLSVQIIRQNLEVFPHSHKHFSDEIYQEFEDRAMWHEVKEPRMVDATSVAIIMRRRGEVYTRDPLKSKFLMVSRNRMFCDFARRFCQEHGLIGTNDVGPLIHQRAMAGLLMLTLGYQGKVEFSRRQVLGSCERVLRLRPQVARKAISKMREVKPELVDQLQALLTRPRSVQILADKTLNADNIIANDNIERLLRLMEESMGEKARREADEKLAQVETEHDAEKQELEKRLEEQAAAIKQHEEWSEGTNKRDKEMFQKWIRIGRRVENKLMALQIFVFASLAGVSLLADILNVLNAGKGFGYVGAGAACLFSVVSMRRGFPNVFHPLVRQWRDKVVVTRAKEAGRKDLLRKYTINWEDLEILEKSEGAEAQKSGLFG